jgi:hypothetical protein
MRARGEALHHIAHPRWFGNRFEFRFPFPLRPRGLGGEAAEGRGFWRGGGKDGERANGDE